MGLGACHFIWTASPSSLLLNAISFHPAWTGARVLLIRNRLLAASVVRRLALGLTRLGALQAIYNCPASLSGIRDHEVMPVRFSGIGRGVSNCALTAIFSSKRRSNRGPVGRACARCMHGRKKMRFCPPGAGRIFRTATGLLRPSLQTKTSPRERHDCSIPPHQSSIRPP